MTSVQADGHVSSARPRAAALVVVSGLVGLFVGAVAAGAAIALGSKCFDGVGGAGAHYAAAILVAALAGAPRRWRPGARPWGATVMLAVLVTFVLRRWLTGWVNLEALEWGSGPAGELAALVLPLEGAMFGTVVALDAGERS
jgi:hypothetical protein